MKRLGRKNRLCLLVVSGLLGYGVLGAHTMADTGAGAHSEAGASQPALCQVVGALGGAPADRSGPVEGPAWRERPLGSLAQPGDPLQQAAFSTERPGDRASDGAPARQPPVVAQATDFNALVQMAEADCQGRTYQGPRHPSDHSRFHCVNAFFLQCRRAQGAEYRQAYQQACAQLQAAGMHCPHC